MENSADFKSTEFISKWKKKLEVEYNCIIWEKKEE